MQRRDSNVNVVYMESILAENDLPDEPRKVWDNIHGFIYFDKSIWDFIDTPHFQRLRKIKQLGTLQYVFPGATNTRFQHSIGTAYLAKKFMEILIAKYPLEYPSQVIKKSAIKTVTLAALLHDIGHGPYSHTFDSHIVTKVRKPGTTIDQKWKHEKASVKIFQYLVTKTPLIDHVKPQQTQRIKALISGEHPSGQRLWQFQIVSNKDNGIDVDKFDYFRRDAFYFGAKNIFVDHDLLMKQAEIIDNQICFPTKYVQTVYNIFHCRYKLYKNYYFNLVSKCVQLMICDILKLTKQKFPYQSACESLLYNGDPTQYIRFTDGIIDKIEDIYEDMKRNPQRQSRQSLEKFEKAVGLLDRLKQRKIYKFVREFHYFFKQTDNNQAQLQSQQRRVTFSEVAGQRKLSSNQIVENKFKQVFEAQNIHKYIAKHTEIDNQLIQVIISDIGFGLKQANPLKKVGFFRKQYKNRVRLSPRQIENLSMLFTNAYVQRSIAVFIKQQDQQKIIKVDDAFYRFCKDFNAECSRLLQTTEGINVVIEGRGNRMTPGNGLHRGTQLQNTANGHATNPLAGLQNVRD